MAFDYRFTRYRGPILAGSAVTVRCYFNPDASMYTSGDGTTPIIAEVGLEINDGVSTIDKTSVKDIGAVYSSSRTISIDQNAFGGVVKDPLIAMSAYTFRFWVKHPVTNVRVYGHPFDEKSQSFSVPVNITASQSQLFLTAPKRIRGIHGSLLHGDYVYGSARFTNDGCIVKVQKDDYNDTTVFMMYTDATLVTRVNTIDQIVQVGDYIFGKYPQGIFRFDMRDDTYKVYTLANTSQEEPLCSDGEYLYAPMADYFIRKYRVSDFLDSHPQFNAVGTVTHIATYDSQTQGGYIDNPIGGYIALDKGRVHSICVDDTYIYAAYTTNSDYNATTGVSYSELHKINKDTMLKSSWVYIPKSTDDMTQNDTHIFLGAESNFNPKAYGHGWGAYNVRKSDLVVRGLAPLSNYSGDLLYDGIISYASIIFGDYLIDMKTDMSFYLVDISNPDDWSLSDVSGKYTLGRFTFPLTASGGSQSGLTPNDIVLDFAQQVFHTFTFNGPASGNSPSGMIRFSIPGFTFTSPPTISALTVSFDAHDTHIEATVTDGGHTITASGMRYGPAANDLSTELSVPVVGGKLTVDLLDLPRSTTYYFQFFATNSEGTTNSSVSNFVTPAPTYGLSGKVFIGTEQQQSVKVILIDMTNDTIVSAQVTNVNGEYSFNGLANRNYIVLGYYIDGSDKYRLLPKILLSDET